MIERFESIYAANRRDLYAYLCRMSGNSELAQDLLHDAYLNFIEHYRTRPIPEDSGCRRILFRISRNLFINHIKSAAGRTGQLDASTVIAEEQVEADPDLTLAIRSLITALPERERTAIILRYLQSLKLEDIGAILGLSVSATSRLIDKAEKMLEWEAKKAGIGLQRG